MIAQQHAMIAAPRVPTRIDSFDRFLTVAVAAFILAMYLVSAVPGLSRITHLTIGLIFLGLILRSIKRPLLIRIDLVMPLAGLFIAYALASVLWSANQGAALVSSIGLLVDYSGAFLLWMALQNGVSAKVVAIAAGTGAGIQGAIALNQYLTAGTGRAEGLVGNANALAIQLSLTGFLLLLLLPRERWPKLAAFALIVVATLTTGTRKLIFVWFSYIILLLRELSPLFRRQSVGSAIAMLLAPLAIWASVTYSSLLLSPLEELTVIERIEGTFEGRETSKRSNLMEDALRVWWEKPVFGHGVDQYRYVGNNTTYSHNNYTELLADFGVVGLVLYYVIFVLLLVRTVRGITMGSDRAWVVLAMLLAILLMDLARVSYSSRLTWVLLAVLGLYSFEFFRPGTPKDISDRDIR